MKNTLFNYLPGNRLSREEQIRRLRAVIQGELTQLQRETLTAYYFQNQTMEQIARERGVCKQTVSATLKRAERKIGRVLQY